MLKSERTRVMFVFQSITAYCQTCAMILRIESSNVTNKVSVCNFRTLRDFGLEYEEYDVSTMYFFYPNSLDNEFFHVAPSCPVMILSMFIFYLTQGRRCGLMYEFGRNFLVAWRWLTKRGSLGDRIV